MKKHALLIGINSYPKLGDLHYAVQDAKTVGKKLVDRFGFAPHEITLMTCAKPGEFLPTQNNIENQLRKLREIEDLDFLIVGFWGHGFIDADSHRYLCACDTRGQHQRTSISLDVLRAYLVQTGAKNTILILDCPQFRRIGQGAEFTEEYTRIPSDRDIVVGRVKKAVCPIQRTFAILSSCEENGNCYEWQDSKHSIFTTHLLDAMEHSNRAIDWFEYTHPRVFETARDLGFIQNPSIQFTCYPGWGDLRDER